MKTIKTITIIIVIMMASSCKESSDTINYALSLSGSNMSQIESVLNKYSKDKKDSLKLKSAYFLIKNMPKHHSYRDPLIDSFIVYTDTLFPNASNIVKRVIYNIPMRVYPERFRNSTQIEDLSVITSEYLESHIENMINLWGHCPWMKAYSFDDFCEYILPYRIANEPLLTNDSVSYSWGSFIELLESYQYTPKMTSEIKLLQEKLWNSEDQKCIAVRDILVPGLDSITYHLECIDDCYYMLGRLRAIGLPAAIDFVPGWPYRNHGHFWVTLIEPTFSNRNLSDRLLSVAPKVYRMTFSHNPIPIPNGVDSIPDLFKEPFYKDVSNEYINVSNLRVDISSESAQKAPYIYLAIFNNLDWLPIAWTKAQRGHALFKDVGRGMIYLPVYYEGKRKENASFPILLDKLGRSKELIPNSLNRSTIKIRRKYPLSDAKILWAESLKGACFIASNEEGFNHADTLFTICTPNRSLAFQNFQVSREQSYRYLRICKEEGTTSLAEIELYDNEGERLLGTFSTYRSQDNNTATITDGDPLTYLEFRKWIQIDFGLPKQIKQIRVLSRTDDNAIIPGDVYELFYFSKNGWHSLALKKAESSLLVFDSVPSGALYWLRNHSRGTEERIFTYNDGRIEFW